MLNRLFLRVNWTVYIDHEGHEEHEDFEFMTKYSPKFLIMNHEDRQEKQLGHAGELSHTAGEASISYPCMKNLRALRGELIFLGLIFSSRSLYPSW